MKENRRHDRSHQLETSSQGICGSEANGAPREHSLGAGRISDAAQIVANLAGGHKRVLELGPGGGPLTRSLLDLSCQVIAMDVEELGVESFLHPQRSCEERSFDVIVSDGALEHLQNPAVVLRDLKKFLRPGGYLVASLPNAGHLNAQLALLSRRPMNGAETAGGRGPKLFTKESVETILAAAGFAAGPLQRVERAYAGALDLAAREGIAPALLEALSRDPEASTFQFVIVGYPLACVATGTASVNSNHGASDAPREPDTLWQRIVATQRIEEYTNGTTSALEISGGHRAEMNPNLAEDSSADSLYRVTSILSPQTGPLPPKTSSKEGLDTLLQENVIQREELRRLHRLTIEAESRASLLREQSFQKDGTIELLSAQNSAAERRLIELRKELEEQQARSLELNAKIEIMSVREKDLREMLLEAHDQLLSRDEEIAGTLAASLPKTSALKPFSGQAPGKFLPYQLMIQRIRESVRAAVTIPGKVAVISKGDDQLLSLEPCQGSHFPQTENGKYAGYHPADDNEALAELKNAIQSGIQYLLVPQTCLWWLDHYRGLSEYLRKHSTRVIDHPDVCVLFDLGKGPAAEPAASVVPREDRQFGVNLAGHLRSEKGVGEGVRSTLRSLTAADIPVVLNDFTDVTSLNLDSECSMFSTDNPYSVNLLHANADCVSDFVRWKTPEYFEGRYTIGYWAWELSHFPPDWKSSFQWVNEVWVPSTFVLDSVSRVSPVPVVAMPHSMPELEVPKGRGRAFFGLPKDKFLFLFMFDFMSILQRKNPLGLIEAFRKAFKPRHNAMLVLKVSHAESYPAEYKRLEQAAKNINITIIKGVLTRGEINGLLNCCDCYVSLHRSEGFGLTMAEAMTMGKPVIATGYSGNLDFMSSSNSLLVNHKLVKLEQDYPPYPKGAMWADPDTDHAAELMQLVLENRKLAQELGKQAQRDIRGKLGAASVGRIMRDRFARLGGLGKISVPPALLSTEPNEDGRSAALPRYVKMVRQTRKMVHSAATAGANVIVISKGDEALLQFEGRTGWHFPRQDDGTYAGFYPSDSAAAIGQLEILRAKGGEYLLIPQTAIWWLEFYADFSRYLDRFYRQVASSGAGVLYSLANRRAVGPLRASRGKSRVKAAAGPQLVA